jgi:hypothetical protein
MLFRVYSYVHTLFVLRIFFVFYDRRIRRSNIRDCSEAIGNDENEHKAFVTGMIAKTVMNHLATFDENATMAILEDTSCIINILAE